MSKKGDFELVTGNKDDLYSREDVCIAIMSLVSILDRKLKIIEASTIANAVCDEIPTVKISFGITKQSMEDKS